MGSAKDGELIMARKPTAARELAAAKAAAQRLADKLGRAVRVSVDELARKPAKRKRRKAK